MFHFQGTQMLLLTDQMGNCQLYDIEQGVLQHEFEFYQSFNQTKKKVKGDKGGNSRTPVPNENAENAADTLEIETQQTNAGDLPGAADPLAKTLSEQGP